MKGTNNASREKVYEPAKKIRGERLRRTTGDRWGIFMLVLTLALLLFVMAASVFKAAEWLGEHVRLRSAEGSLPEDAPAEGIARIPAVARYLDAAEDEAEYHTIEEYREGDAPVPEWYNPEEPMAAEWVASCEQVTDLGCPDWNLDTTLWGWDGHGAEAWEMDLFARVFYLEFWGTSIPCSEAGCDAILNLWDTGEYGRTLFEALSYYDPDYGYTYRVYPHVWETEYDADGLAWCKEFCTERFLAGPEWSAVYFQLGGYHDTDWVPPLYEMDGVYFSGAAYGGQ